MNSQLLYHLKTRTGFGLLILTVFLLANKSVYSQTTVNSLSALLPYLNDNNANVKLAPGTYNVTAADISAGKFSNPIFLFEGSNSTYDFTGVTINFDTAIFKSFGRVDVKEIQVLGNNNVLKNLKMVDNGSVTDNPSKTALGIALDGSGNRIEGFHMTVKGSWPYGYGDAFGKGGSNTIIYHYKHSAILVRGESNHLKNCTVIHRSYGHAIFMQAANNPLIEGCYVEGEMRSTDDMLLEEGTGTRADDVNFMTTWGYRLPAGYMMSTGEEGIRAYNGGETFINGVRYERGTSNPTILNCTIKNMRAGVTLTHATGTKYVEGCVAIGCERGYAIGSGDIVNCSADAQYGPIFGVDYENDRNITADITVLPYSGQSYNGSKHLAIVIGSGHDLTFKSTIDNPDQSLKLNVGGDNTTIGLRSNDENYTASNININNLTKYPLVLASESSDLTGESCGTITNNGSDNDVSTSTDCNTVTPPPTGCSLPWTDTNFTVTNQTVNYSSEAIDISCASAVTVSMDIKGEGNMESADYINVYYKIDGGTLRTISENTDSFASKTISVADLEGDNIELIIQAYTSYADETYSISNIKISESSTTGSETSTIVHMKKRNASTFAIDGNHGGADAQNIYLWSQNSTNKNQQWIEIDRGNGYYSYQKQDTNYCIDGNNGGASGQNVYLWTCQNNNQNQHWEKVSMGSGAYKLIKRNASGYALNGGSGGANGQNVNLYSSSSSSQNLHWIITPVSTTKSNDLSSKDQIDMYPNPTSDILNISLGGSEQAQVSIINMTGQVIKTISITEGTNSINVSQLATGLYTVKIFSQTNSTSIKRLIIQ
ncbi:hypothetical protein GCM10022393_25670 [Aquimarina addita]|uniref:T9SS C-terminal target domain-containing protein n=1 Tax=Aquimarina addita TaxID=870485 RepID=A0ABP6ULQ0_9FLAO